MVVILHDIGFNLFTQVELEKNCIFHLHMICSIRLSDGKNVVFIINQTICSYKKRYT